MQQLEIIKALANENRMKILTYLKTPYDYFYVKPGVDMNEVGACVDEIQRVLGLSQSTTSTYMGILKNAGLVIPTRLGKWTYYRRNEELIQTFLRDLSEEL